MGGGVAVLRCPLVAAALDQPCVLAALCVGGEGERRGGGGVLGVQLVLVGGGAVEPPEGRGGGAVGEGQ